jgi:hypothetical protein
MDNNVRVHYDCKGLPWMLNSCTLDSIRFLFGKCYHFTTSSQQKLQFRADFPWLVQFFDKCWTLKLSFDEKKIMQMEWINRFINASETENANRWFHVNKLPQALDVFVIAKQDRLRTSNIDVPVLNELWSYIVDMIPDDAVIIPNASNRTTATSWKKSVHMEFQGNCNFCDQTCKFCINQLQVDLIVQQENLESLIDNQTTNQSAHVEPVVNIENIKENDVDIVDIIATSQFRIKDMIDVALDSKI